MAVRKRALIVDDDRRDAELLFNSIRRAGGNWFCVITDNLGAARRMLTDAEYDICFADYFLAGGMAEKLAIDFPQTKVVLTTLESDLEREVDWCRTRGVKMVLRKPCCVWKMRRAIPYLVT